MSLTRPLTRPLTRKISRADLTQGFGGSFSPFALNPYLLFDARDSMVGTLENPTLDLNPALPETLDVITATRAGTATFTDANGNIATASPDTVRVDQTQGAELTPTKFQRVGYTDFSQGWAAQSGVVAQGADDYQGNAVRRLTFDGVTTGGIYQTTINTIGGVSYTGSFYIRRISGSTPLYMRHGFSASGNQTAISVTTEWQQFSVTMLGASGGGNVYFGILQFGAGNDVYEITQPQFEEGTTASDFVANTTGSPKFITGATYGPRVPMILVEPSATNSVTNTDFSTWSNSSSNDSVGSTAPYGNFTKLTPSGNSSDAGMYKFISLASGTFTQSCYAKFAGKHLSVLSAGKWTGYFDLQAGTATGTGASIQPVGNGVFRCSVTGTDSSSSTHAIKFLAVDAVGSASVTDDGVSGVEIAMPQLEVGSVATSFIPTSGSTAQRAADDLVISGSAFSDFYNQSEGTLYFEGVSNGITDPRLFEFSDGTSLNRTRIDINDGSNFRASVINSGSVIINQQVSFTGANSLFRAALSFKLNDLEGNLNGSSVINETPASLPTVDQLHVGSNHVGSGNYLNGHIKRLIYWPYHSDSL